MAILWTIQAQRHVRHPVADVLGHKNTCDPVLAGAYPGVPGVIADQLKADIRAPKVIPTERCASRTCTLKMNDYPRWEARPLIRSLKADESEPPS